ncbi:MAG: hypothetical protein ISS23_02755 [Nanoarchaeota archaeon]|nr:hypothetical protein [Nanoarchaeota archaeon]
MEMFINCKTAQVNNTKGVYEMTFSIIYESDGDAMKAVDWDWLEKGKWAMSYKEGQQWISIKGPLDEEAYEAILEKFGIEPIGTDDISKIVTNLLLETVTYMGPKQLETIRRGIEYTYKLPPKEIKSDTLRDIIQ